MKRIIIIVAVAMLAGGCTTAYWQDREHDAAGVNPGELADFALGWFGVDIYGDDTESRSGNENGAKDDGNC